MSNRRSTKRQPQSLINLWNSIKCASNPYRPPKGEIPNYWDITTAGLYIQRSLIRKGNGENDHGRELTKKFLEDQAQLDTSIRRDPNGETDKRFLRLGAAYHLWPYYAAQYYGWPRPLPVTARLKAREKLCKIQELLYSDIHHTLDYLRLSFGASTASALMPYLTGEKRKSWRSDSLIYPQGDYPDLCAVDGLAAEMVTLEEVEPDLLEGVEVVQQLALKPTSPPDDVRLDRVRQALVRIGIAQMTIFYDEDTGRVTDDLSKVRMKEIVYEAEDEKYQSKLAKLISLVPFVTDNSEVDPDHKSFRRLASSVYASDAIKFPIFAQQRKATLEKLSVSRLTPSGETTWQFLTAFPGFEYPAWPCWYATTLADLSQYNHNIKDWSDISWWSNADWNQVLQKLFPPSLDGLHINAHASALWDYLAENQSYRDQWQTVINPHELSNMILSLNKPAKQVGTDPRYGYLMEMLLRRNELQTRTSFFLGVSGWPSLGGGNYSRLKEFVGGTFIGLERPGLPYAPERFNVVLHHLRSTLLALVDCSSTLLGWALMSWQAGLQADLNNRINELVTWMEGGPFQGLDHTNNICTTNPSLRELSSKISALKEHLNDSSECLKTLKALFYWNDLDNERECTCSNCVKIVLEWLLGDNANCSVSVCVPARWTGIELYAKPGIRCLLALAQFIHYMATTGEATAGEVYRVTKIRILPTKLTMTLSAVPQEDFKKMLWNEHNPTNFDKFQGHWARFRGAMPTLPENCNSQLKDILSGDKARKLQVSRIVNKKVLLKWDKNT